MAKALLQKGHQIFGLVRAQSPSYRLNDCKAEVVLRSADIGDGESILRIFSETKPDVIYHLAAAGVKASKREWLSNIATNILGTQHVIEACRAQRSVRRLIYTNSCLENQVTSNPALAANPYVCSKYFATLLVSEAARCERRFTTAVATLFSVYGEDDDEENLINFVIRCLRRGKVAELGSGKAIRDWIYVEDAAEALVALAQDRHNKTHYHIGTATGITVRDVAEKIATILQQPQSLRFDTITDRGDELIATIADAQKLVPSLPPPKTLEEALPRLLSSSQFAIAH